MNARSLLIRLSCAFAATLSLLPAHAQTPKATNLWDFTAAAGLTLTRGNSETLLATVTVNGHRKTAVDEWLLGAAGTYGETTLGHGKTEETDKTAESLSAFVQYNRPFTDRWYGGARFDFLHDAIADLDYRFTLSPLVGYYAIKETNTTLAFEAGPSGIAERQGGEDNQYAALRLAERFEHKFASKSRVWQSLEFLPQIDRWHNYIINAEIGAEAPLTEKFSLRAVLQDTYDNEPAPHRKNNDLKLITSLAYTF